VCAGPFRSTVLQRGHFMNQAKKQVKNLGGEKEIYFDFFSERQYEKCKDPFRWVSSMVMCRDR
jgi:hypothetical protein